MCQCANTTAGCEHHKQRKQKQQNRNNKTQHRIFILCHPLPFRSIVVCIGARTLHLSRHLASVFAPFISPLQLVAWYFCVQLSLEQFAAYHGEYASPPPGPTCCPIHAEWQHILLEHRLGRLFRSRHRQSVVPQQASRHRPMGVSHPRFCNKTCDFVS